MPYPYAKAGLTTVAWGSITGTLADQTDLQSALDNKADVVGGLNRTSDVYWEPYIDESDYSYISSEWQVTSGAAFNSPARLDPVGSPGGWIDTLRPTSIRFMFNSGVDPANGGTYVGNTVTIRDMGSNVIATASIPFTAWEEDVEVDLTVLDFGPDLDIAYISVDRTCKNEGPIITLIEFTLP